MSTSSNPAPDPKTLLVVDDDLSVLTVVRCMLETGDYNVLLAHSAEVALRLVERDYLTIDLVLLDVVMPDLSGPELAERLLAIRPDLKVLFMSGYADAEVVRVKILGRKLELLPKPFTSDGLRDVIDRTLNTPMHRSVAAGANGPSLSRFLR
jgi:two-component system cell cycle sensor histidine kinase/response regulator CckA